MFSPDGHILQVEYAEKTIRLGSASIGMVCKDGIIMAADRRATAGNLVMSKNTKKAVKLNDYLVVSGTGMASDIGSHKNFQEKVESVILR